MEPSPQPLAIDHALSVAEVRELAPDVDISEVGRPEHAPVKNYNMRFPNHLSLHRHSVLRHYPTHVTIFVNATLSSRDHATISLRITQQTSAGTIDLLKNKIHATPTLRKVEWAWTKRNQGEFCTLLRRWSKDASMLPRNTAAGEEEKKVEVFGTEDFVPLGALRTIKTTLDKVLPALVPAKTRPLELLRDNCAEIQNRRGRFCRALLQVAEKHSSTMLLGLVDWLVVEVIA